MVINPIVSYTNDLVSLKLQRNMEVRYVIRALKKQGWKQVRMKGDHRQFHCAGNPNVITVAGNPKDYVPIGTLKNIERLSGLRFH